MTVVIRMRVLSVEEKYAGSITRAYSEHAQTIRTIGASFLKRDTRIISFISLSAISALIKLDFLLPRSLFNLRNFCFLSEMPPSYFITRNAGNEVK